MNSVRLGLIGMGNIGRHHAGYLLEGKVPRCELRAVCSTSPGKLASYRERGLAVFGDALELIRSRSLDAVLIATPHYQHTALGTAALEAGLHVMVEKPISAHKADAERLLACAAAHPGQVLAGMFQLRVEPRYARLRELITSGELGRLQRVSWIITDWFRTDAYYASGDWRATWRGEGGGVLLNQCLHNLDVLAWLLGMPARVRGFGQFGRWHNIEVEDQVTAYLEWADGLNGVFITSTGEAPGTNRLELAGSRGKAVLEHNRITFTQNEADALEWSRSAPVGFSKPATTERDLPFENHLAPHAALMANFVAAILDGAPLIAPGADGLHSVELANSMVYSSLLGQTVELPLDGAAWELELQRLISQSKFQKEVRELSADDFAQSFRR
ncbi:MAG TPA: Gfo/Idh/MocA family oxidoreductase [Candidatus Limnocylindria bacterium]|jgi:predicted dehydrogenase|nr:Gfo/Idh/MocA family oxidoreductase [Candidatus Limnocylindria bacterium]